MKGILDRLRLAKEPRAGDFGGQLQTHGTENGTPCAEPTTCTTLFASRNQRLDVLECVTHSGSVPNVQPTTANYQLYWIEMFEIWRLCDWVIAT